MRLVRDEEAGQCGFLTVESGRFVPAGCRANPDGLWTARQARNLLTDLVERADGFEVLIRDRASQFTETFDAVLADAGITVCKVPPRSPQANACARGSSSPCAAR